jgi:hypothetical protein
MENRHHFHGPVNFLSVNSSLRRLMYGWPFELYERNGLGEIQLLLRKNQRMPACVPGR